MPAVKFAAALLWQAWGRAIAIVTALCVAAVIAGYLFARMGGWHD